MTISVHDVSIALIENKVPHTFTIAEAKDKSDFFNNRGVSNILKKMSNTQCKIHGVIVKRIVKIDKKTTWEWERVI